MPTISRQQDSQFRTYPSINHSNPNDGRVTVGQARDRFRDQLDLDTTMIALVNGRPSDDNYTLQDDDMLFFKVRTKERGSIDRDALKGIVVKATEKFAETNFSASAEEESSDPR